jgi:acyl transferase domain-containing protein
MNEPAHEPIAIIGISAIMPDAPDASTFWANITSGRYSISDVPPGRWDPGLYYDPDPAVPDKTYSRIGGWVRDFAWDPVGWRLPIPPMVAAQLDDGQKWAIAAAREALSDAGWPQWTVDPERVAVIIGNAIGGEKHYRTDMRIGYPEFARELAAAPSFAALPEPVRAAVLAETQKSFVAGFHEVTEDTMPGELANIIAGRVASLFNFRGPNFTTDAACASGLAAMSAAVRGLQAHDFDAAVSGGVDRNMSVAGFVKFCKIGALSASGTRPFDAGADGFVMGEGAALFVLKRLSDAERDGDRIHAVLLGIAGSSDGKGKGITAPNPVGQRLALERAWRDAGVDPATATAMEAHGTSTRVGDAVELESLTDVFGKAGAAPGSIALGSVKSNIGHLKAAAGAAGLFKAVMSVRDKMIPPSLNFVDPNPNVDWTATPFRVNTTLRDWPAGPDGSRRIGVSAFGFGGTNFHVVLEDYVAGRHLAPGAGRAHAGVDLTTRTAQAALGTTAQAAPALLPGRAATAAVAKAPLRGAAVVGGASDEAVVAELERLRADAAAGRAPAPAAPDPALAGAPVRVAIDFADAADLAAKADKAIKAARTGSTAMWRMLRAQGVFLGRGPAPKVAFLYPGQGSQYVNMLRELRRREPIVANAFAEADRIMTPLLHAPLSAFVFADAPDKETLARLEERLLQTEITQPAVLTADLALAEMLAAYGIRPDMVMGHSLGEYGALMAAGALSFDAALEAVSARGHEMASLALPDNGAMAAVFGPLVEIERIVASSDGYVVVANINSTGQAVVGGATAAVEQAIEAFRAAGMTATRLPVSHAFHTAIVAPASEPLKASLHRLDIRPPRLPIVANVTGTFYPTNADLETMLDILGRQVASPVQFVAGLHTLYDAGARVFVEVGPKKALHGFVEDVLGNAHDDVLSLFTNHPKVGDVVSFNQALCGLYAAGLGLVPPAEASAQAPANSPAFGAETATPAAVPVLPAASPTPPAAVPVLPAGVPVTAGTAANGAAANGAAANGDRFTQLGRLFASAIEEGLRIYGGGAPGTAGQPTAGQPSTVDSEPIAVTGAALALPGVPRMFDDSNVARILAGQQFIDTIPLRFRRAIVDRRITRLVKRDTGDPSFETIDSEADVVKLAARHGPVDVVTEFGIEPDRDAALDVATRMAIGAGFDALRDAGVPLVMRYKTTSLGTSLPERWGLPDALRDETGVIFASAFPAYDAFADDLERYFVDRGRREQLAALEAIRARMRAGEPALPEVDRRIAELRHVVQTEPFMFDRRFLFRCLSMGHSQFAEIIGARGPNTQVNSACASTTQAFAIAEDWIRAGRCRRVVIVAADDVTSDRLLPWVASGFLASGAAATDDAVEDAATPFDRRRHGMIIGTGAVGFVVESAAAARERGLQPICDVLGLVTANSAYHGTRLDVEHIGQVMEEVIRQAEARGIDRHGIAASTVFMSHETYTPARGGSAAAEINALRRVFGADADSVVIANTKGFTGHTMAAGIEDAVAVKALETGIVPPVPNFKEPDPELGDLNLSAGGFYPVRYALRLAAGFGSQIAMSLLRWTPVPDGRRRAPNELGYAYRIVDPAAWQRWLTALSGRPDARLEVAQRRLRIVDVGPPPVAPTQPGTAAQSGTAVAAPIPTAPATVPPTIVPPAIVPPATVPPAAVPPAAGAWGVPAPTPVRGEPAPASTVVAAPPATVPPATVPPAAVPPAATTVGVPPAATTVGVAPAPVEPAADPVAGDVVGLVSKLTGYPPELLDLDLDLEADLGVDTVKQAEVFAAVRTRFDIDRDDSLKLRDFPTLNHIIGWIRDRTQPTTAASTVEPEAPEAPATPTAPGTAPARDEITDAVVTLVSQQTGYPPELLDLDLDLEADLGVDTVKQAEVFAAVRTRFDIDRDDSLKLRDFPTLNHIIGWIRDRTQPTTAASTVEPEAPEAPATPTAPDTAPARDEITDAVVTLVSQQTGYPPELLDLDLDLEADLGIDTVKQAEVFAAVRTRFDIDRDDSLKLRDFPTLNHIIGWIRQRSGAKATGTGTGAAQAAVRANASPPAATPAASVDATPQAVTPAALLTGDIAATDRIPRRIPVPVLRPELSVCTGTGVALGAGTRVVVMMDEAGVGNVLADRLAQLGVAVLAAEPGIGSEELAGRLDGWLTDGPVHGVYWLPALDDEGPLPDMDLAGWREALRRRVGSLFATMRRGYDQAPFLVTGTRLGGWHGYDPAGATCPLGGAVTGFAKAYRRERPQTLVKAVDVGTDRDNAAIAELLIAETLRDPGCIEVGYADGRRWGVGLAEQPFTEAPAAVAGVTENGENGANGKTRKAAKAGATADDETGIHRTGGEPEAPIVLGSETVFLVTGAAGSIVSAITADLATASHGTFHLLDLIAAPDPADPDLRRYVEDRDGLKVELAGRMRERGERPTPVAIDRELARLERQHAALAAMNAVSAAGGTPHYHRVDLTDAASVAEVIDRVRDISGRVDVLLHAAGVEISHALPDKEPREFDLVLGVKANGWFNLMHAAADLPIGATVVFSSIAGRFGNAGQTDYSAANDLLCKLTSNARRSRPQTRAIALDWTAWAGIGMATRGSIPEVMRMSGVQMLPPEAGIAWIRRELTGSAERGEVVVAGELGRMSDEFDPTGGLDTEALTATAAGPMVGKAVAASVYGGLVVHTTLDPAAQPFLYDHRIEGTPVLPGVMAIEAFAEAARLLVPGWHVAAVEDVDFRAPLKFYRDEPREFTVTVMVRPAGADLLAYCRLTAERTLPGSDSPQRTVHFTGTVRLSPLAPEPLIEHVAIKEDGPAISAEEVYRIYFHGPAYRVIESAWRYNGGVAARYATHLPANHQPAGAPTALSPRLAELCFQTAGLWDLGREGRLGLPLHVGRLIQYGDPSGAHGLVAVTLADGDGFTCTVLDRQSRVLMRLEDYRTVAMPQQVPDDVRAPLHAALAD